MLTAQQISQKWLTNLQNAQTAMQQGVQAVSLSEWQQAMVNLGIPRAIQGAQEKQSKYTTFMQEYATFLQSQVPTIQAMPKGTLAQGIARATAMITASYNWGQSRA